MAATLKGQPPRAQCQDDQKRQSDFNGIGVLPCQSSYQNSKRKTSTAAITGVLQEQPLNMSHLKQHAQQSNITSIWTGNSINYKAQPVFSFQPANQQLSKKHVPSSKLQHPTLYTNIQTQQNQWQRQHQQVSAMLASVQQDQNMRIKKTEKVMNKVDENNSQCNISSSNGNKKSHQRHQSEIIGQGKQTNLQIDGSNKGRQVNKENEISMQSYCSSNNKIKKVENNNNNPAISNQITEKSNKEMYHQQQQTLQALQSQSQQQWYQQQQLQQPKEKISFLQASMQIGLASNDYSHASSSIITDSKTAVESQLGLKADYLIQGQQQFHQISQVQQQQQKQQTQQHLLQDQLGYQQQQQIKLKDQQKLYNNQTVQQYQQYSQQQINPLGTTYGKQINMHNTTTTSQPMNYPQVELQAVPLSTSTLLTARTQIAENVSQQQYSNNNLSYYQSQSDNNIQQNQQALSQSFVPIQSQSQMLVGSLQSSSNCIPQTSSIYLQVDHLQEKQVNQLMPASTNLLQQERTASSNPAHPKSQFFDRRKKSHSITSNIVSNSSRKTQVITQQPQPAVNNNVVAQLKRESQQENGRIQSKSPSSASNQVWQKMNALMSGIGGQRSQIGSNILTTNLNISQKSSSNSSSNHNTNNNNNNLSGNISSGSAKNIKTNSSSSNNNNNTNNTNNSSISSSQKNLNETGSKKIAEECSIKKLQNVTFTQQLQSQRVKSLIPNSNESSCEEQIKKDKQQDNNPITSQISSTSYNNKEPTEFFNKDTYDAMTNQFTFSTHATFQHQNLPQNTINLLASSQQPLIANKYSTLQYQPQQTYSSTNTTNYNYASLNQQAHNQLQIQSINNRIQSIQSSEDKGQLSATLTSTQSQSKIKQVPQKIPYFISSEQIKQINEISSTKQLQNVHPDYSQPSGVVKNINSQGVVFEKINLRIPPPLCSLDKSDQPAEPCSSMADHADKMCLLSVNDCNLIVTTKNKINLAEKNEQSVTCMVQQRSRRNGVLGEKTPSELPMQDPIKVPQDMLDASLSQLKQDQLFIPQDNLTKSGLQGEPIRPRANPFLIVETFNDDDESHVIQQQFESSTDLLGHLEKQQPTDDVDFCNLECDEVGIVQELQDENVEAALPTFISCQNGLDPNTAFCQQSHKKLGTFNIETMHLGISDVHSFSSQKQVIKDFQDEPIISLFNPPVVLSTSAQKKAKIEKELLEFARIEEEEGWQRIFGSENLEYLVSREADYHVDADYLSKSKQPNITSNMRQILLDWMMEVAEEFGLKRETYHIAVSTVDRYLSVKLQIKKREFQLIGVTALYMASKLEEIYPPRISDFVCSTNSGYAAEEINERELSIIENLNYLLNPPTISMWSNWFMCQWDIFASQSQETMLLETETLIQFKQPSESSYMLFREYAQLVDLSVLDFSFLRFNQRHILASFMYLVIAKALNLIDSQIITEDITQGMLQFDRMEEFNILIQPFFTLSFGLTLDQILLDIQFAASFFVVPLCTELPSAAKQDSGKAFQVTHNPQTEQLQIHN